MNKQLVFQYIAELEKELLSLISNNRFRELIISEIINESIIVAYELSSSSKSDEETAKGIVAMYIQSFYEPKHLAKVEDKFWNNRLQYGFRGRIMTTPDNLIRFRMSVDCTRKDVSEERAAMLHAVSNYRFENLSQKHHSTPLFSSRMFLWILFAIIAILSVYAYAASNRFQRINQDIVFDSWTGKSIDVFESLNDKSR